MRHSVRLFSGPLLAILAACCSALLSKGSVAQDGSVTQRMLDGVVYVECDIAFQGKIIEGSSGTGFLVGAADHVVTNNHVISECNPENHIAVLKTIIQDSLLAQLSNQKMPPEFEAAVTADAAVSAQLDAAIAASDKTKVRELVGILVDRLSTSEAKNLFPYLTQSLFVSVVGKSSREPVKFDVARIVWSSEFSSERARDTGVDIAVLRLDRAIPGGIPPAFAASSSANVGEQVYAVGFPGASGAVVESNKYSPRAPPELDGHRTSAWWCPFFRISAFRLLKASARVEAGSIPIRISSGELDWVWA
jgi:S1-C subfamily serine protease